MNSINHIFEVLLINLFKKASGLLDCLGRKILMLFLRLNSKYFILSFLLFTLLSSGYAQNLDSLQNVVVNSSGNEKARALYELSLYQTTKNDSLALDLVNDAINEIQDNEKLRGKLIFHKGIIMEIIGNDFDAIRNLKEAVVVLNGVDTLATAESLLWLSIIHKRKGMFPEALNYGFSELELRKQLKDSSQVAKAMFGIGYSYDRMGEYHQAVNWHKKGLNYYSFSDNKEIQARGNGLLGIAYDELNQYDSALYYNKKAVEAFKLNGQIGDLKTWYSNIGNTYIKMNDLKNAESYTLKSLEMDVPLNNKSVTLVNLGKIYLESGRYQEAQKILDSAMSLIWRFDQKRFLSEGYYRIHELRKKQNRYAEALEYFEKYKINEDELLNEKKAKQIAELGIQYETAEKEKEILVQRAELAEYGLIIQKRNYQMYGLTALALILGLIGYFFYNQQKLKNVQLQKENELKDALLKIETQNRLQEQRLRISRDLHDNIGSQLTFIISSIDNLKYGFDIEDDQLKKKLNEISDFASETIYELRDTIWAMNKSEITFDDLESRISNFIEKAKVASSETKFNMVLDDAINKELKFSSIQGMNMYRIIQEAINNAIKYAKANNITFSIVERNEALAISVVDDGIGFSEKDVELGNGLNNIKKRATDLNAVLLIESKPEQGTNIQLLMPLNT